MEAQQQLEGVIINEQVGGDVVGLDNPRPPPAEPLVDRNPPLIHDGVAAQRAASDSMLSAALQATLAVASAYMATEAGQQLLLNSTASNNITPIDVFAFCMLTFLVIALAVRVFNLHAVFLEDCSALLIAMMVASLIGVLLHDRYQWVVHVPFMFPVLLIARLFVAALLRN